MKSRPTSITVICWILIVMGGISLTSSILSFHNPMAKQIMSQNPISITIQYIMMYLGTLIMIGCGIAMLKGQNWARFLYIIWSVIGLGIGIVTSPMKAALIPGIIIFLIVAFLLFRPKAKAFFAGKEIPDGAEKVIGNA